MFGDLRDLADEQHFQELLYAFVTCCRFSASAEVSFQDMRYGFRSTDNVRECGGAERSERFQKESKVLSLHS